MGLKLEAKAFETKVKAVHDELVTKKTGKLLSTKVELKDKKTLIGDRFAFIDKLLSRLGIHVTSRTNEKDAALTLKKFAIANSDSLSKDLQEKLGELVDVLETRAEATAKDKGEVKKEFDAIKKGILDLTPTVTWRTPSTGKPPSTKTPSMKAKDENDFQHTAGELLGVDSTEKAKLDKFCKDNKEFAKPEVLGTMLGRIASSKSLGDKLQEYIEVLVDNGATLDVKHAKTNKTPLETYQAAHAGNIDPAIVALLTKK